MRVGGWQAVAIGVKDVKITKHYCSGGPTLLHWIQGCLPYLGLLAIYKFNKLFSKFRTSLQ